MASFSSDSLLGVLKASEQCSSPIVKWLVPPCPPHTHNIEVQTEREVVKELQEEGTGTEHCGTQWRYYQGLPYCHFGTFSCFSCMAQEDRESSSSDSDADGLNKVPIWTPSRATD